MGDIAEAYTSVLSEKLNNNGVVNYAIHDYCADFAKFWLDNDKGSSLPEVVLNANQSTNHSLIIVWDDLPTEEDTVKLGLHLTPLDWALAFSTKALRKWDTGLKPFSIHIIDLTSSLFCNSFAMQMSASICEAMPWVKLYTPLPRGRRAYEISFPVEDIDSAKWPQTIKKLSQELGANAFDNLSKINQAWRASIFQSNDHHDVSNHIGPCVLTGDTQDDLYKRVMLLRLEWAFGNLTNRVSLSPCNSSKSDQKIDVLVIDDQLSSGWDKIICCLLGVEHQKNGIQLSSDGDYRIYGLDTPKFFRDKFLYNNGQLDISLFTRRKLDLPEPTIIVLDLYLFHNKDEEKKWYLHLSEVALKLAANSADLAWFGFEDEEADQLKKIAENGVGDLDVALSLFPRLCALRWPTVPIVVLSATNRRGLITKLAKYGNILLCGKPNILASDAIEQMERFVDNWHSAIGQALKFVSVQKKLHDLRKKYIDLGSLGNKLGVSSEHIHIVIAFDETGNFISEPSAVGGVILFIKGDNKSDAIEKSFLVQESIRENGVKFYSRPPFYQDAGKGGAKFLTTSVKGKKSLVSHELRNGLKDHDNAQLAAFCLWVIDTETDQPTTASEYQDGPYLRGLSTCVELIACELLPSLGVQNYTISWWFPTKVAVHKDKDKAAESAKRYDVRYDSADRTETVGGTGHAYSLVVSAIGKRHNTSGILNASISYKSRKIPYDNNVNNHWQCTCGAPPFRPEIQVPLVGRLPDCPSCGHNTNVFADYSVLLHLADAVLSPYTFPNGEVGADQLNRDYSFELHSNHILSDFLHVARLIDDGQPKAAFNLAYAHSFFLESDKVHGNFSGANVEGRVQMKLFEYSFKLKGVDILRLLR